MKKSYVPMILIISIIILNIVTIIIQKEISILGIIVSLAGVIAAVMSARGHVYNYYFSMISVIAYAIIAFNSHFYGTFFFQFIFYLPIQFWGLSHWKKNLKSNSKIINTKKLNINTMLILLSLSLFFALLYSRLLTYFGSNLPIMDATINLLVIVATILSVKRYNEQWLLWIIINILTIIMWLIALLHNTADSLIIIFTWLIYLINSIYGYINWKELEEKLEG